VSRKYQIYLDDMRLSCEKVLRYTHGLTLDAFVRDEKTFDAVVRNLEILGEAAKHVPLDVRERHPQVEWRKIAGLRDVIAHEYFGIDEDILWDIIRRQVPLLLEHVRRILAEADQET
jgi:uncharacterized protein with HEPN domain